MSSGEIGLSAAAVTLFLVSLLCRFVLPGVRFTGLFTAVLAGLMLCAIPIRRRIHRSPRETFWRRFCCVLLSASVLLFAGVEGLLLFCGEQDHTERDADAVIVLGAGVNGETPSLILQSRIDAAAAYLAVHPNTPAVLSGGQGPGEEITEAEAMRRGLMARGIPEDRLFLEEYSVSTAENFSCSASILEGLGMDLETAQIGIVTSNFHCCRANLIARSEGLHSFSLPAKAPWPWLNANYYLREFFALGKTLLLDLQREGRGQ